MGEERTTNVTNQTQTATPTEEERRLNELNLEVIEASQPGRIEAGVNTQNLLNLLLTGQTLPGQLGAIGTGIDEGMTDEIVQDALGDLGPSFQGSLGGAVDIGSPALQAAGVRTAGDIRRNVAESNLARRLQLLGVATGAPTQLTAPVLQTSAQLSQALAGLRTVNQSGTQTGTTSTNFFASPFGAGVGSGLGQGFGTAFGTAAFGGCWVAKEIFGGWHKPKTILARNYILNYAPSWFREFYLKNGERIAEFISNKPIFKALLRPMFELFALRGKEVCYG